MINRYRVHFVLLFAALLVSIGVYFAYSNITRNAVETLVRNKSLINILTMVTLDYKKKNETIYYVITINPENRLLGVTFLPSNLRIDSEGDEHLGDLDTSDMSDLNSYIKSITNLNIHFYMHLYGPDIKRGIDMLEGADMYILDQAADKALFPFGLNYLDGAKTVQYLNLTNADSPFSRFDRMQDLLLSLYYSKTKYQNLLTSDFLSALMHPVKTNITLNEAKSLISIIMKDGDMFCNIMPGTITEQNDYAVDEIAIKLFSDNFLKKLLVVSDEEQSIRVKILNASGISGLARKVRANMVRDGITVVEFGTYPGEILENSVIINQSGDVSKCKRISELTGVTQIYHVVDSTQMHEVLYIAGRDLKK